MVVHLDRFLAALAAGFKQAWLLFGRDVDVLTKKSKLVDAVSKLWRELVEKIAASGARVWVYVESHFEAFVLTTLISMQRK
jgi:hypothetical protein